MLTRRLLNGNPKIGIRPIIDGRRGGIREGMEAATMEMAQCAADLITTSLKYSDGTAVECVIAPTCIGGVAEAMATDTKFQQMNVGASLSVTLSWCYPLETIDQTPHIPKAIWGFNSTERPGAVYLAAAKAAHDQIGMPVFAIYGREVQEIADIRATAEVSEQILRFARSAIAVASLKGTSYLSIGGVSMGIAGCIVPEEFFRNSLGMRCEYVDMSEVVRRIEWRIYDPDEFVRARSWVTANCREGTDVNPPELQRSREQKDEDWDTVVKMALIVRDLMIGNKRLGSLGFQEEAMGHNAIAAGFQGQRSWTDHFPNGDFMEAVLNSSFDWDGAREPFIVATENDSLNAATLLFGQLLTNRAQIFADVRSFWSPESVSRVTGYRLDGQAANGVIHLTNSGPAALDGTGKQKTAAMSTIKPFWELEQDDIHNCLTAVTWHPAVDFFRGGGFSSCFVTEGGMPMTMSRLNRVHGVGPVLQIAEGWSVTLPQAVHDVLNDRTNPTWPTTWFVPRLSNTEPFTDVYAVMSAWGSNHCALSYGHIGADLISMASMLRIPVSMHNVAMRDVFRPSAWTLLGASDAVGADYRACRTFGPLYG